MISTIIAVLALAVSGENVYKATSPDGRNEIRITASDGFTYSVWRDGKVLISDSPIAMDIAGKRFPEKVVSASRSSLSGTLKTPL